MAVKNLDAGLYQNSFCRIYPDHISGDNRFVNVMHADGAGTKSILAYLYWKETGDLSVWRGIAVDAVVMNLDDLLCVGIYDNIIFNSTIDRNKKLIPGEVLKEIIEGTNELFEMLHDYGVNIHYLGGETADVGDVVRTVAVNGTMAARWPKDRLITNDKIRPGDVIIGLAGFGQANYEKEYNSGLGSNGLTSARHDALSSYYRDHYPETFEPTLDKDVTYIGHSRMTDNSPVEAMSIGKLLLSPTRTFAPVIAGILKEDHAQIHGMIHCSGGGQTKCLKYLPGNFRVVKDNLFTPPPVFDMLQKNSGSANKEMYEVFNMGTRMEVYCDPSFAGRIIETAQRYGVDAKVVGRVEPSEKKELHIVLPTETLVY